MRLHAETHAGRCAGGDHVARVQRNEVADIADQLRHAETIVFVLPFCIFLPLTSVHSDRFCGSGTSSFVTIHGPVGPNVSQPLPLSQVPPRSVWNSRSTRRCKRNNRRRNRMNRLADISCGRADHDAELNFPVQLLRPAWPQHVVVRPGERAEGLEEHDRLLRHAAPVSAA